MVESPRTILVTPAIAREFCFFKEPDDEEEEEEEEAKRNDDKKLECPENPRNLPCKGGKMGEEARHSYRLCVLFGRDNRRCGGPGRRRRTRTAPAQRSPGDACRACPPRSPLCRRR